MGNLLRYTGIDSVSHVILWGYKNTRPIAIIDNVHSFSEVYSIVSGDTNILNGKTIEDVVKIDSIINKIRIQLPTSQVRSYSSIAANMPISATNVNGIKTNYIYDRNYRLNKILDNNENSIVRYDYNYDSVINNIFPFDIYLDNPYKDSQSSVTQGEQINFCISVGGSDNYSINWKLYTNNGNVEHIYATAENVNTFSTIAYQPNMMIECVVNNNITNETKSVIEACFFSPNPNLVAFSQIVQTSPTTMVGNIIVPVADTLVIWMQNRSTSGNAVVGFGEEYWILGYYETKTVEIPCTGDISFHAETFYNVPGTTVHIHIQSLKNNTVGIDPNHNQVYFNH
jgi:hypothetical protein